ncbi:hypothetical protein KCU65_g2756, partial [Aureobasidium melanogenum]
MQENANMEGQAKVYNIRDSVVTQDRIFHYYDGITRHSISYFRESAQDILNELNLQQELLANKRGISTV